MTVHAADERAHEPGASSWWWETWHLDAATDDGIGLSVRLACAPALGVAWWWTYLVLPDLPGPVVVRDHEVPLPRQGLEVRADGLWGELTCETALEHWSYGLEAFGVRLDEPGRCACAARSASACPVGLDIEWEVEADANAPHERPAGWPVTRATRRPEASAARCCSAGRGSSSTRSASDRTRGASRASTRPRRRRGCTPPISTRASPCSTTVASTDTSRRATRPRSRSRRCAKRRSAAPIGCPSRRAT